MASRFDGAFTAYRIVRADLPAFEGAGAHRWGARWTSPGRYVIHAPESYALAVLENLVHFNLAAPYSARRKYGDRWYDAERSAVLVVPSVLSPYECNVLINQRHRKVA